jgi:parvulin-like peptidyl-prolyl isomerase
MVLLKTRIALPVAAVLLAAVLGVSACGGGGVPRQLGRHRRRSDDQARHLRPLDEDHRGLPGRSDEPGGRQDGPGADAPDFKQCIADKKKTAAKPAKGQPEPTDAQYKTQCQQQYSQFKDQVLGFLIRSTWLDQEANRLKVKVADKTIVKQIDDIKKQQFAQKGSYEKFLQNAGLTNEDVLYQQRIRELQNQITTKVTKGKDKVTDAQIAAYYNKNKSRFSSPERRDLRIVLTKDKAKAARPRRRSNRASPGSRRQEVLGRPGLQEQGRRAAGVAKGQQEPAFDKAIFAAKKGKLTGPSRRSSAGTSSRSRRSPRPSSRRSTSPRPRSSRSWPPRTSRRP